MDTEFNTEFIDETIENQPYSEYPSQMLLSAWCDANDSITPHFIDRKEWEEMGDEILMDEDEQGKKILYIPKDLTLIETVDIVVAVDKDTYKDRPELSTKGVEKIGEVAQTFRKAGKYIEENLDKVDKGKNIAEDLSKKFSNYGYDLESRVKKVNKDIEVVPPVELTEEDRNKLDKWFVGGKIYTKRIERITGKKEPTPEEMVIHKEEIDRERERFFKGYFKALGSKGYEGIEGEKPWERDLGPISNIQEKTETGITNAIKGPEHQILESIFDRGLEGLLMELNVPQEKERLYDFLDIPGLKKDLEEVRRNNPDNLDYIAEVEREIAEDIHLAVVRRYRYKESSFKPSEILKGDYLNCLGSTLVGTALLDEVGIKYLYVFPPRHSTTYLVTSNGKLYIQDFTPQEEPFTHRPETFEITNDMFEGKKNILELARITDSFYVKLKREEESIYITQNKDAMVATILGELGASLIETKQYSEAKKVLEKALELDPNNATIYNNLGGSYAKLRQRKKAIDTYKKAIELDPNHATIYNNLGNLYAQLRRHNHAIEAYKKAIELDPNKSDTYYNLGDQYVALGQYNHAEEAYKKVMELVPDDTDIYISLGDLYAKLGQWKKAMGAYNRGLISLMSEFESSEDAFQDLSRISNAILRIDPENKDAKKYLEIAEREINSPTST